MRQRTIERMVVAASLLNEKDLRSLEKGEGVTVTLDKAERSTFDVQVEHDAEENTVSFTFYGRTKTDDELEDE